MTVKEPVVAFAYEIVPQAPVIVVEETVCEVLTVQDEPLPAVM
jgi:hypothetical protein